MILYDLLRYPALHWLIVNVDEGLIDMKTGETSFNVVNVGYFVDTYLWESNQSFL